MNSLQKIKWIKTGQSLVIYHENQPITIKQQTNKDKFKKALSLLQRGEEEKLINYIFPKKRIESYSKGDFSLNETGVIEKATNEKIPSVIANKLLEFSENSYSYTAIKKFWENLKKNPNKESVKQLYNYLEKYSFPITIDGHFLAYKYVTEVTENNIKSINAPNAKIGMLVDSHSYSFDNSPGKTPTQDRNKCDSDPKQACSSGLHVAAFEYAKLCGEGKVIIEVKVNPKDVVSVPEDYQFQKIRVCKYEVMKKGEKEVKDSYIKAKKSFYVKTIEEKDDCIDLEILSAREIVELIKNKTGIEITLSLKNKQSIVKKAKQLLKQIEKKSSVDVINLEGKTASEIIDEVKNQTGELITLSLKNKKAIVKKAQIILVKHGLSIK